MSAVRVAAAFMSSFSVSPLRRRPCIALRTVRPVALLNGEEGAAPPVPLAERNDVAPGPARPLLRGVAGAWEDVGE